MRPPARPHRHLFAWTSAVLALTLGTAACGASESSDESGTITVLASTGATFEPLYIAEQQGFFDDLGLDVEIEAGAADTSQNVPSVLNGEAQFAMTDSAGFLKAAAESLPIRMMTNLQVADPDSPPASGLVVPADSGITTFADLAGKTIAMPALAGTLQFIVQYSMEQEGADPSTVKFVALPLTSIVDAVDKGKVDGAFVFSPVLDGAKAQGLRAIGEGANILPGLPQALLFSSAEWAEENPEEAAAFLDALEQGMDYANEHPDAVRAIDTEKTTLPADYIANRTILPFTSTVDVDVLTTVAEGLERYGITQSTPDVAEYVWTKP